MTIYRQTGKMGVHVPVTVNFPDPDILKRLVVSDSGFIFDPLLGKSYSTNSAGLIILKYIQSGKKLDDIIENIIEEFNVSREVAERDIIDFVNSLQGQMK